MNEAMRGENSFQPSSHQILSCTDPKVKWGEKQMHRKVKKSMFFSLLRSFIRLIMSPPKRRVPDFSVCFYPEGRQKKTRKCFLFTIVGATH